MTSFNGPEALADRIGRFRDRLVRTGNLSFASECVVPDDRTEAGEIRMHTSGDGVYAVWMDGVFIEGDREYARYIDSLGDETL